MGFGSSSNSSFSLEDVSHRHRSITISTSLSIREMREYDFGLGSGGVGKLRVSWGCGRFFLGGDVRKDGKVQSGVEPAEEDVIGVDVLGQLRLAWGRGSQEVVGLLVPIRHLAIQMLSSKGAFRVISGSTRLRYLQSSIFLQLDVELRTSKILVGLGLGLHNTFLTVLR